MEATNFHSAIIAKITVTAKMTRMRGLIVIACPSGLKEKAEPPTTRDVNRDSGTESANGGWLRRLVRPRCCHHKSSLAESLCFLHHGKTPEKESVSEATSAMPMATPATTATCCSKNCEAAWRPTSCLSGAPGL